MDNTDYLYASDGSGEAPRMTITGARSIGATTIPVDSVTNVPDRFIATSGTLDPDTGLLDPSTLLVFKGHVSGSDLEIDEFAPGYVDAANTVGQIVVIKPTTLWADLMADSVKANQKFPAQFSDFVEPDGAVWTQSSGLNGDMTAGYVWFNGSRNAANAIAGQLFTASKDTYVDIDPVTGDPTYVEVANGAAEPAVTTDNVRVAKIVTDASGITSISQEKYTFIVATGNIEDSAITTSKIADAAVSTAKIADEAVTSAKLAPSVTTDANGWTVRDFGTFKEYTKSISNGSFAVGVGEQDVNFGTIATPAGVTIATNNCQVLTRNLWAVTSWSFTLKGLRAVVTGTSLSLSAHVNNTSGVTNNISFIFDLRVVV